MANLSYTPFIVLIIASLILVPAIILGCRWRHIRKRASRHPKKRDSPRLHYYPHLESEGLPGEFHYHLTDSHSNLHLHPIHSNPSIQNLDAGQYHHQQQQQGGDGLEGHLGSDTALAESLTIHKLGSSTSAMPPSQFRELATLKPVYQRSDTSLRANYQGSGGKGYMLLPNASTFEISEIESSEISSSLSRSNSYPSRPLPLPRPLHLQRPVITDKAIMSSKKPATAATKHAVRNVDALDAVTTSPKRHGRASNTDSSEYSPQQQKQDRPRQLRSLTPVQESCSQEITEASYKLRMPFSAKEELHRKPPQAILPNEYQPPQFSDLIPAVSAAPNYIHTDSQSSSELNSATILFQLYNGTEENNEEDIPRPTPTVAPVRSSPTSSPSLPSALPTPLPPSPGLLLSPIPYSTYIASAPQSPSPSAAALIAAITMATLPPPPSPTRPPRRVHPTGLPAQRVLEMRNTSSKSTAASQEPSVQPSTPDRAAFFLPPLPLSPTTSTAPSTLSSAHSTIPTSPVSSPPPLSPTTPAIYQSYVARAVYAGINNASGVPLLPTDVSSDSDRATSPTASTTSSYGGYNTGYDLSLKLNTTSSPGTSLTSVSARSSTMGQTSPTVPLLYPPVSTNSPMTPSSAYPTIDNSRPLKSPDRYHDSFSARRSRKIDAGEMKLGLGRGGDINIGIGNIGLDYGSDFRGGLTSAELLASWLGDLLPPESSPEKEPRINHPQAPGGAGTELSQFNFDD